MLTYYFYFRKMNVFAKWLTIYAMEFGFLFLTLAMLSRWKPDFRTLGFLFIISLIIGLAYAYVEKSQVVYYK